MKLLWFCPNINARSGYSDEARVLIRGLQNFGLEVNVIGKKGVAEGGEFSFQDSNDHGLPIVFHTFRHGAYTSKPNQYSITRTMLEVTRIPQNWVYRFKRLNEIWVPNDFCLKNFRDSGVNPEKIFVVSSPAEFSIPAPGPLYPLDTKKNFIILSLFHYHARYRKGLDMLLKAYIESFTPRDDLCLVLKTNSTYSEIKNEFNLPDQIPEIQVLNTVLDKTDLASLYRRADCFILPSRGEGIGRPFLEAMQVGTPIITTGWGGQCEFLNRNNSFLIQYEMVDVQAEHYLRYPGFFGSQWAEPDISHLKSTMQNVYRNYDNALIKSRRAQLDVEMLNVEKASRSILDRLENPLNIQPEFDRQPHILERLFPLYYPGIRAGPDVFELNQMDFQKEIKSIAVYGIGKHLNRAIDFFYRQSGLRNIVVIPADDVRIPFKHLTQIKLQQFSEKRFPVDIVILTVKLGDLRDHFFRVIGQNDTYPIYFFDGSEIIF